MYPILLKIGDFTLHTYGVLLAIGFLIAVYFAVMEARRIGIDHNLILDLSFYLLIAALVGSRVFYILGHLEEFRENPIELVQFWRGGLVYYGGLIFAFLTGLWYIRKHRLSFPQITDLFAPPIAIGLAVGRLGCFSAG